MTLSETAQLTKKIIVYASIVLVVIIAVWASIAYYLSTRPVEVYVELPTKGFGILPKPALPKTKLTSTNPSFVLDTETGALPTEIPALMKVYSIPKVGVTFSSPEKAKRIANNFLFKNGPEITTPTLYKFTDDKGGELIYQLDTGNYRFKRPVASVSAEFRDSESTVIEGEALISSNFKKYLNDNGTMPNNLAAGKSAVFYNSTRPIEATEAAVTLWQDNIKQAITKEKEIVYPLVTPDFKEGLVKGTVTRYQTPDNKYLSVDYIFWQIDTEQSQTYPIKTVEQAYEQLQSGEGITILPYSKSSISIEKVYLAYFLPKEYVPYLQPVYVFEGPQFAAFVPAITSENFEP